MGVWLFGSDDDKIEGTERLLAAYCRLFTYDEALVRLGELLAREPILVPSGQEKPRVRVRYITHPQRSYQDVQNELAVQLANLPRFTAYASIQGAQRMFRLSPPIEAKIDEQRIERIRWISKAKFGRLPKPPVHPAASDETAEQSSGPRISREHPDEE